MKISVVKRFRISAGHHLKMVEECSEPHGHNYTAELYARYEYDYLNETTPPPGTDLFLRAYSEMKNDLIRVMGPLDNHNINDRLGEPNPTSEWFALYLFRELQKTSREGFRYKKLRLYETEDSFVEVESDYAQ